MKAAFAIGIAALLIAGPAAAQSYKIRAGDTLRIEVLEDSSLNRTVLVAPDGRISVPSAGTLRASGQTVETVQNSLTQRLASSFAATPNVFVSLERLAEARTGGAAASISVYVMGEVNKPGKLDVTPNTSVLQMFAVMGGFTKFAATKRIQLRRTNPKTQAESVYTLNYPMIEAGKQSSRAKLMDGDVIVVPQRRLFE
ncbi:polysaccharide export protein (plasmid) [Pseudorhodobacter turbinis]|uniref:Polysaccharide export protein n=2 Tax=Pseudorhodobacter turbinis TaxID=2500533 RepID=A0A4P8EM95_9RHOB|nr:polysaccharide export protein [Pseudorhodobacter turbinis]